MSSYGKKEYWNARYSLEEEPSEWIVHGYAVFEHLLAPDVLSRTDSVSPSTGEIYLRDLRTFHDKLSLPSLREDGTMEAEEAITPKYEVTFPLKDKCRVLHVGCGSSLLGEYMLHHGFCDITNVDYSEVVIRKMREKYDNRFFDSLQVCLERKAQLRASLGLESRDDVSSATRNNTLPKMVFEVGDITEGLHYADGSFDLIICKKTLDMVLCSAGSIFNARSMMSECFRLLNKEHGVMVILSSAKPEDRAVFFEQDAWSGVEYIKLPSEEDHDRKAHMKKKIEAYAYMLFCHH